MSPSLRSRLLVFIGPDRVSIYKLGRGLRPRLVTSCAEALEPPQPGVPWQALAQKLAQALAAPEFGAAEADVVLSNKLARHALVPYDAQLKKPAEREAYARHVLAKTWGPAVAQWELRLSHQKGGLYWMVSAVDRTVLDAVRQGFAAQHVRLRGIRSRLMLAYNHHRNLLATERAWLVIRETGFSLIVRLEAGRVVGVGSATHESLGELPVLLDRENLASGQSEWCKTVYLVAAEDETAVSVSGAEYQVTVLDPIPLQDLASGRSRLTSLRRGVATSLQMDLHKPIAPDNRRAGWMLLAAGVFMAAEVGISWERLGHASAALANEMAAAHLSFDDPAGAGRDGKFRDEDYKAADQAMSRLHTPWEDFFAGLESVSNKRVAVLSVMPDMRTGVLRVSGMALDNAALLTLLAQLRKTPPFSEVYLVSQDTKQDDPQRLVQFVIQMRWDGLK